MKRYFQSALLVIVIAISCLFTVSTVDATSKPAINKTGYSIDKSNKAEYYGQVKVTISNFAHIFYLCTLKIQYLAVIQLSKFHFYAV